MASKLDLTPAERAARRAQQSRECRARKAGDTTVPAARVAKAPKLEVDSELVNALKAAQKDLNSFNPFPDAERNVPTQLDLEEQIMVKMCVGVAEYDGNALRSEFKAWAADKPWRELLRLGVAEQNDPNKGQDSVHLYISVPA